jgi:hypothetical protein
LLNPIEERRPKYLIILNFYILFDRMAPRIGGGDRQHQSNREIGAHP